MNSLHWAPVANHLWQSTLFGAVAVLLVLALKENPAQIRYRLWLAASLKFLVPFSLLLAMGSRFEWRTAAVVAPPLSQAITQISRPFEAPIASVAPTVAPAMPSFLPALAILVWLGGCAVVLGRWWMRWSRVRVALRAASRLPIAGPIEVMSSPARLEPGIFGVFRPILLLPEGIADRLTPAQLQAILAHEFCHVRRRDNLAAAIHMVVETVFWFHPLVWWIGARLIEERERACDEEVLRLGSQPEVYATGILNVCKFYLESPLACAVGVTGANLKKRIEAIMTRPMLYNLTLARKLLLATAGIAALAGPILLGIVNPRPGRTQAQAARLRFEVATIKPTKSTGGKGGILTPPGGGLRMGSVTLKGLIGLAYDVRESQISGGPAWISSETYDIEAKPERPDPSGPSNNPAPGSTAWKRLQQRLQSLLAERFRLVLHKDGKAGPIYALVVAKGGFKLQPVENADEIPPGTMRDRGHITGRAGTMQMLATVLSGMLGRHVEDRTGLTGRYTYKVEYSPEFALEGKASGEAPSDANSPGPSVFTALQEQLGLKLESTRGTLETLVIDRAEKPSGN
jgi:bla regulator protein BlaR1